MSGTRGAVAEKIAENTEGLELLGVNVPSFIYQTTMSMGDSALHATLLGPTGLAFMGGEAAANQMQDIIARGGNNRQVLLGGLAAGIAEAAFEKFSLENFLKPKTISGWKSLVKETAKQAGIEASEEVFTEIANILSDTAIMGRDSRAELAVRAYMMQGMSEEEAGKQLFFDQLGQVAAAGAGGLLSGIGMGSASSAFNYAIGGGQYDAVEPMQYQNRTEWVDSLVQLAQEMYADAPQVDTGIEADYNGEEGGRSHGQTDGLEGTAGYNRRVETGEGLYADTGGAGTDGASPGKVAGWAQDALVHAPGGAAGQAVKTVQGYGVRAVVVQDVAIKARNPSALALTEGGIVYLSDTLTEEQVKTVAPHEAVHAVKQRGSLAYESFLENTGGELDLHSDRARAVINLVAQSRFDGQDLLDLTPAQQRTVFDELNALVWGCHMADAQNARAQFRDVFTDYDSYIRALGGIMEAEKRGTREQLGFPAPLVQLAQEMYADAPQEAQTAWEGDTQGFPAPLVELAQEMAETSIALEQTAMERVQLVQAQAGQIFGPSARAFGWNGQAALLEAWTGQRSTPHSKQSFYDGFALYYQAGLTGEDMNRVYNRHAWALTEPQKQAAYRAGQQDAAVFAARGRDGAGRAQALGRGLTPTAMAGTIDSGISQDLTDTESGTNQDTIRLHDGEQSELSARLGQGVTESGPQKPGTVKHIRSVDFSNKHAVLQQLMQAQTDFAGLDYEMNCTVTSDGKVWRVSGTSGQVSPWGIEALGSSLRGSYSYHNHPPKQTWYSFSAADVRFFFAAGEECAIAADDVYTYVMRRTEDTLDVDPEVAYHRFDEILSSDVGALAWDEVISFEQDGYHETMKRLCQEFKIDYTRRRVNGPQP